jgi:hypothetical protein
LRGGADVLVPATREVDEQQGVAAQLAADLQGAGEACADSMAGMMPSVLQSSSKAAMARSSVA